MWNIIATLLVFAVMAGGLFYAYSSFSSASSQQQGQDLQQEVGELVTAVNTANGGVPNFVNLSAAVANTNQYAPSTWQYSSAGADFLLPEGGTATMGVASVDGGNDNGYVINLSALNPAECSSMGGFNTSLLAILNVNGTSVTNPSYGGASGTTWPQNLGNDCKPGAGNTVTLTFIGQ